MKVYDFNKNLTTTNTQTFNDTRDVNNMVVAQNKVINYLAGKTVKHLSSCEFRYFKKLLKDSDKLM